MDNPKFLAQSLNGSQVFTDINNTNIQLHLIEYPNLLELVEVLVKCSIFDGENVAIEHDMGGVVGKTSCVNTTDEDEIIYAKRLYRDSYSRFVNNRRPEDTQFVTAIFQQKDYGYRLWSAWCGRLVPSSPDSEGRMNTSKGFWANHALVYDPKIIESGSERKTQPDSTNKLR